MIAKIAGWALLLVVPSMLVGCAPAYHDYPQGCVRYGYCPPPPLPLVAYPPPPVEHIECLPAALEPLKLPPVAPDANDAEPMPYEILPVGG
jgi:hypothetical protein